MRFYERVEYSQASATTGWSIPPLMVNVALGAVAIVILLMYQTVRQRRLKLVRGQQGQLTLMDILLLALLLAGPLAYWRYLDRLAHRDGQLAARIAQHGQYRREALVPAWLTASLPGPLVRACLRTTMVRLDNPPDDLVAAALENPRLRALRIGGGRYDLRLLDRLPGMTRLHDLAIEGRVIDAQTMQLAGAVEQLRTLSLRRTNVSAESLQLLNPLQRLRMLDLRGTEVQLDASDYGPWASSIEQVALPRPDPGVKASMKLDGWPSLKRLICAELDASLNNQPMQIVLTNLPKLESVELGRLQLRSLTKLRLAGWQLSADTLAKIASLPNLQRLDLSRTSIDAATFDAIATAAPSQLTELVLRGCTLDSAALMRLARSSSQIRFDLREADVSVAVEKAQADAVQLDSLEAWRGKGSTLALCASTYRHIQIGWEARGSGTSDTVSNQGWQGFATRLQRGEQENQRVLNLSRPPAVAFRHRMQLAVGQGYEIDQQEAVIQRAVELYPAEGAVHEAMVYWLLPRWGGTHGESSGYAAAIADLVGGSEGDSIYLACAITLYDKFPAELFYPQTRFDVQRMQRGIEIYLRQPSADRRRLSRLLQIVRDRGDEETAERICAAYESHFGSAP